MVADRVGEKESEMKIVEPSGVVMRGQCDLRLENICVAREHGSITAVWTPPGRTQTNVCKPCLDEMIRREEWKVEGLVLTR